MQLRSYQDNMVFALATKISKGIRKIIGQLATGGGKTVIFASISSRYIAKSPKSVLILVHRKELLFQTRKTLHNAYGIIPQMIVAGMKYIPPARVYIGMVESVNKRIDKLENIGLVIIDEAHIASFNKIHEHFPKEIIIGFSATPLSSNKKKPIKLFYEDIICGVDIPQLIKEGFLCQNMTWAPKDVVDRTELAIKAGEFDEAIMAQQFSKSQYVQSTVSAYERWGKGKKTIIFNVNMAHNKIVNETFYNAGYPTKWIDSEMPDKDRDAVLKWFKETPDAILQNVGIATVGFDEPTIEVVIVNKSTMSMPLWLQMDGRGGRIIDAYFINEKQIQYPYPLQIKSLFTIIDMGGNAVTHGDWCQSRDWEQIFFDPPKPGDGVAPVKDCPQCCAIIPAGISKCPECGFEFPKKEALPEEEFSDFVMVTKNINVEELVEQHKLKKEYYPFFKIGYDLAVQSKATMQTMSDEKANFILQKYHELARKWTREANKKRDEEDKSKIKYNQWHQDKAKDYLFNEIKKLFPEWEVSITQSASIPAWIE